MNPARWAQWIAGLWAGVLLCIGLMAAPAVFAMLAPQDAGRVVGRMFAQEAYLSLALALLLIFVERSRARMDVQAGKGYILSTNLLLLLGTAFCTIAGYFAVQPMMAAARAGQGAWSFGALHAVSVGFFGVKALLICILAWRFGSR